MESSLHRQLKDHYASGGGRLEARVAGYRIDVQRDELLVEIQHGSLAAIRDKIRQLTAAHPVLVVKPIVHRKRIIRRQRRGGRVVSQRWSPRTGTIWDLFDELIFFTRVFPRPNLTIEVPLVEIEEYRVPGHGRRRRWRSNDHVVEDQRLVRIHDTQSFSTAGDLLRLIPVLGEPFDTAAMAQDLGLPRFRAQRIAYCLRHMGAVADAGKRGNARLYRRAA